MIINTAVMSIPVAKSFHASMIISPESVLRRRIAAYMGLQMLITLTRVCVNSLMSFLYNDVIIEKSIHDTC